MLLANAGIPMIAMVMPMMILALAPIVFIEAAVLRRSIDAAYLKLTQHALYANLVSTIVGIPLTWFALVLIAAYSGYDGLTDDPAIRTLTQPTWLPPMGFSIDSAAIYLAGFALCVPFFVASALVEGWLIARLHSDRPKRVVHGAVWKANTLTYALLAFLWLSLV